MYIDSLAYQTREFMYAYGFGFILGIVYDLTRIIRLLMYKGKKKVFIWDIIYAVVASFLQSYTDGNSLPVSEAHYEDSI